MMMTIGIHTVADAVALHAVVILIQIAFPKCLVTTDVL